MRKIRNLFFKIRRSIECYRKRRKLKIRNFTIIANNCWAGSAVYVPFGLKVNTPTYDLAIMDEHYIKFLEKFDYYLSQDLQFINPEEGEHYELRKKYFKEGKEYPVGRLDDIEVWFFHYKNKNEAAKLWNKRKKKINRDKLLVKWSERYKSDNEDFLQRFINLPFDNKIAFVTPTLKRKFPDIEYVIAVPELKFLNMKGGDETNFTLKYIDIHNLINSLSYGNKRKN